MEPAHAVTEQRLTIVPDELQAEMLRSVLETHGIASVVRRTALGEIQWGAVNIGMGGPRELIVSADDLAAARELLDADDVGDAVGAAEPHDPQLVADRTAMNRLWVTFTLVLFGAPIVLGLLGLIGSIINAVG